MIGGCGCWAMEEHAHDWLFALPSRTPNNGKATIGQIFSTQNIWRDVHQVIRLHNTNKLRTHSLEIEI